MSFHPGDTIQHFRNGKHYRILGKVWDTRMDGWIILYQGLYDDPDLGKEPLFVRPEEEFEALVENAEGVQVPRFSRILS